FQTVNVAGRCGINRGLNMLSKRVVSAAIVALLALSAPVRADSHIGSDTVVATVDGTEITLAHMIVLKLRLPAQYQSLPPDVLFEGILDQLVQQTILGAQSGALSPGSVATLENEERALKASEVIQQVSSDATTDAALLSAYNEKYGGAEPETEFNASHILVETEDEAKALIEELAGGADFATLAQEKSKGPSGPNGGELGWFGLGAMVPPFEAAVVSMEAETVSADPVQTEFGWHVIRLNETRLKEAPTLDQVREEIVDQVQREAIEARVAELSDGVDIDRKTAAEIDPALLDDLSLLGE
ncbi:MAG: peptidylprolyl isomerase, partial [Boseongicola sp.]